MCVYRKKEKMGLCTTIADSMCSPLIKSAPNFPSLLSFSMATLLKMCDDHDSNIRMIADEGLNRIIRVSLFEIEVFSIKAFPMSLV